METYCLRCKVHTPDVDRQEVVVRGRPAVKSTCSQCGAKKSRFLPKARGRGVYELLQKTVGRVVGPSGLTLPGTSYCGPLNSTDPEWIAAHPPKNRIDATCLAHDLAYDRALKLKDADKSAYTQAIRTADREMVDAIAAIPDKSVGEKVHAGGRVAGTAIRAKMGLDRITGNGMQRGGCGCRKR